MDNKGTVADDAGFEPTTSQSKCDVLPITLIVNF